jgi:MEDS: MEthanogen/methylotroph, DcmR Sensory domain
MRLCDTVGRSTIGAMADKQHAANKQTVKKQIVPAIGNFHAVRFYRDAEDLSRIVAGFLAEGFVESQPAIVIATPAHRASIDAQLTALGLDPKALQRHHQLFVLDAQQTLDDFMIDGLPNPTRFRNTLVPIIEQACGGRTDRVVRAYGEMVDVLWKAERTMAATRLETLWNALANTHAFSLLCGYAMGSIYKHAAVDEICSHHSHVITSTGDVAAVN